MKDKFKLQLTAFVADVLAVFKRYQKTMQADGVTLLDLETCTESVKTQLQSLLNTRLIGGWEEALIFGICEDGLSLKGIALSIPRERRVHHLFVPALRDLTAVKKEIVYCLVEFLDQRFGVDQKILKVVKPFIALKPDADIKEFHEIICSDLPLMELSLEFNSIVTSPELLRTLQNLCLSQMVQYLARKRNIYPNIVIALARIWAAKPHSCDVERLISACNLVKTSLRNSVDVETQNLYLYVHFNMSTLEEWDPRMFVVKWLQQKQRRNKKTDKARYQRWFKGVFKEATEEKEHTKDIVDQHVQQNKNAKLF